jgi:hypothetical protein
MITVYARILCDITNNLQYKLQNSHPERQPQTLKRRNTYKDVAQCPLKLKSSVKICVLCLVTWNVKRTTSLETTRLSTIFYRLLLNNHLSEGTRNAP